MDAPLARLRGVGPKRLEALEKAGITGIRALVSRLPVDYRDLSDVRPIATLREGERAAVRGRLTSVNKPARVGALTITKAKLEDDSGAVWAVWFNQPWLYTALAPGRELLLYGRVERRGKTLQLTSPEMERGEGIEPVYRPIPGIPPKQLREIMREAVEVDEGQWKDELPLSLRLRHTLCERNFAMRCAHFPPSRDALEVARRRLAFEELLIYQVALRLMRGQRGAGARIEGAEGHADAFWASLPYSPTGAQRRALAEALADMAAPAAMARMVQGDVGCGKTAVAFGALYACVMAGWQGALMAPTEVLASQHYESAKRALEPLGVTCGLLTGSLTPARKRAAHEAIRSGEWRVAIGTHALITEGVEYERLGLVITDEQHRFGVRQRTQLAEKGASPNVLVMSATPIPRSLSLILYGDLDVTAIDELPPGRTPVKTRVVPEEKREAMYGFVRAEIAKGRQVYVICPLVEDSEAVDARSADEVYKTLSEGPLRAQRVALVHGRMKAAEKDAVLTAFHAGEVDVLVSTTVVEVGVNVPNASVMIVENAERFGLAQLHQLRGRVGRGSAASWCFLMGEASERLRFLAATNDGFQVAQKDLELRGPGDLFGLRQSGAAAIGVEAMGADGALLRETHGEARELMARCDSDEARAVIRLAQETMLGRPDALQMN